MPKKNFPHLYEEKVWRSEELSGAPDTFQDLLKEEMVRYGQEIKNTLETKREGTKICEVASGGGAQGFYSIARSLVMSMVLEKYGITRVRYLCGNSAGGAQTSLLAYYQAMQGKTYRQAVYKTLGKMYKMGKLKINPWEFVVGLFQMVTFRQLTPQNPMEQLAESEPELATVTYGDLADRGYHAFTVFSELVTSNVGFSGLRMTIKQGIRYTTRFYPPGTVDEVPGCDPTKNYIVDGGISNNLPTDSAIQAFNNKNAPHNVDGQKLDFLTVSFLGNVSMLNYEPVKNIPDFFKRLLDYVSVKATARDIKQTVLNNQQYRYGDPEYVPLIPFGAFQDCTGAGVLVFDEKSFRLRFKSGVMLALETLKDIGLINAGESQDILTKLYANFESSPELAEMQLEKTPYEPA
jgi:predicted acylesterase/phospholipase RssA